MFTAARALGLSDAFDVGPDGRLLMFRSIGHDQITVILNWPEALNSGPRNRLRLTRLASATVFRPLVEAIFFTFIQTQQVLESAFSKEAT